MSRLFKLAIAISFVGLLCQQTSAAKAEAAASVDSASIEQATGLKGTFNKDENVFKLSKPRTDVKINVDGWQMPPFIGLTSWAGFTANNDGQTMMMGDTVLFEDEVNPAMSAALDAGLEVTALHNHFFFDDPKVYFMHIGGMGEAAKLAAGVKKIFDKVAEIRAANPSPQKTFAGGSIGVQNAISVEPLEAIFATKGQAKDGMFKVVIGRPANMHGMPVNKEMGINTWAAFAGTDDNAVVDGDFAMTESELQTVLKAMRKQGINIVAIHHHMSEEQPRILFLHYWAKGKAIALATAIKTALVAQAGVAN
ncbi:MAG: DUF1259 domain-containing protein [Hyphomicrobium sp.]|nr:DUF1259 domain-containing protein [Hyphomicrobium sp.]